MVTKPRIYRDFIDHVVAVSTAGQGKIASSRALKGMWNEYATPLTAPDQVAMNALLNTLDESQRIVLAGMLDEVFQSGVFETLKALEEFRVEPFLGGYEGGPHDDFIGRVGADTWPWPE
jgi:hypothetical protein